MAHSPLRLTCRFVLAASVVSLGVASLHAQTPAAPAPVGPNPSRVDVFVGYSYFGAHGQVKPAGINFSSIDEGAIGSGAYYFNKYVGAEVNFVAHPSGAQSETIYSASAGPIFRAPMQNFTLFAHGMAGGARVEGPTMRQQYYEPATWGPTVTVGGGMDYDLPFHNNAFSIRLFQADYQYFHTDFGPYTPPPTAGVMGGRANIGSAVLSTGIVAHFGHIVPPPPVTYACSASPAEVYPGDPLTITGTATNLNPKKTATYTWTTDGGTITGTSSTATIDTHSANPGSYNAKGHVSEGNKAGEMADCSAPYTIKNYEPPTISCSANPSTVNPGDSSTITANGVSPQNRPLTYSYSASAGSVSGNGTTATLATTGAAPGSITVTCNVVDDKGQTASATTTVTVNAPVTAAAPTTSQLCSINFDRDKRRPTRVDNEAKACLDDIALNLQRTSDAKLAVVGNKATGEKGNRFASERAVNAKAYLVTEKGVDASRISVYTGSDDARTVTSTLIPSGATFPATGDTPVDESMVKAKPRSSAPAHHHKKAAQ